MTGFLGHGPYTLHDSQGVAVIRDNQLRRVAVYGSQGHAHQHLGALNNPQDGFLNRQIVRMSDWLAVVNREAVDIAKECAFWAAHNAAQDVQS